MSSLTNIDISQLVSAELNYDSDSHALPYLVAIADGGIKVNVGESDWFYAFSESSLGALIEDLVTPQQVALSFFDGMESFKNSEKIGLKMLDELKPMASLYSKEDMNEVESLIASKKQP